MVSQELLRRYTFFASLDETQRKAIAQIAEPFALSALIPPHILQHTARAGKPCHVLKMPARALRGLCNKDTPMGYILMRHVTEAAMERLHFTRIQLAAAQVQTPEMAFA